MKALCAALLLLFSSACVDAQSFIQRDATHLTLDGKPFRYSGPNLEWLGLERTTRAPISSAVASASSISKWVGNRGPIGS